MSSSSGIVIHEVVDQLLLTGTIYDDLVRTLLRKRKKPVEGWAAWQLFCEIPELSLFFRSNPAFPFSDVLASIPGIQCITGGVVVLYTTTAAAGGQQDDQAPTVVVDSYCNTKLPNAISASSTMDSLSTVGSDSHKHHHAEDAPTTIAAAAAPCPTRRQVKEKNFLARLALFEDQLVDIIQATPDQRIMKSQLPNEYDLIRRNKLTHLKPNHLQKLVGTLKKVRVVKINGSKFVVLPSFNRRVDAPPVNQEALERLEDELVELVQSVGNHRIRTSRGCLEEAYQQKYKKPLKLEHTGLFTINHVLKAMPRLARSDKNWQMLIVAPRRFDDDAPLPPPPLTRSRAAQQSSGRCSPIVSAAFPPTLADPYARSSDLPPPDLPPGLPHGLSSTRAEIPPAYAVLPAGLPPGLPCCLPPGLPTGFGVPESDIPRFYYQPATRYAHDSVRAPL
jgi:hypothetical protein